MPATLPNLPGFGNGFVATNPGSTRPYPGTGGINIGWDIPPLPDVVIDAGKTVGNAASGAADAAKAVANNAGSLVACLSSPGTCLLRLVLLILGLICVAGAIYLYKPTSELIAAPVRAARNAATSAATAAAA